MIAIICFPFTPITLSSMKFNIKKLWAISNQIVINEVRYSRIMGHMQSSNSFFKNNIMFQTQPFTSLLQCQVGLVFNLNIIYGEPPPNLFPHHVVLSTSQIEIVFKLVGFWVIPPLKYLIKPMVLSIDCSQVQQFTCLLNHGFVILSFIMLILP